MNADTAVLLAASMFAISYLAQAGRPISRQRRAVNAAAIAGATMAGMLAAEFLGLREIVAVLAVIAVVGVGWFVLNRKRREL